MESNIVQERLLSIEETCEILGISRATLFRMLKTGDLPSVHLGRLRKIPLSGVQEYMRTLMVEARAGT